MEFADGRLPASKDKIVYVCGAFDLFHIGHLCFLEEARKLGDYLVVGIYTDQVNFLFLNNLYCLIIIYYFGLDCK